MTSRQELLQALVEHAHQKLSKEQADLIAKLIPYYYASVSVDDLHDRNMVDLFGALLSFWQIMQEREPDAIHLSIFNPNFEQHGWQSTHTVIALSCIDRPFLVDSIQNELIRRNITTHIIFHAGSIHVKRDDKHHIVDICPVGKKTEHTTQEAIVFIEIDRQTDPAVLDDLYHSLLHILSDVCAAVDDWPAMSNKMQSVIKHLKKHPPAIDAEELEESIAFLEWVLNDHFIILGYREYQLESENGGKALNIVPQTGLGVLHERANEKMSRHFSDMPPEAQAVALSAHLLIIAKSNLVSTVHRAVNIDIIGVKIFDKHANVVGEHRFVGLYTSSAYNSNSDTIPLLRAKVNQVLRDSQLSPRGHAGKALRNVIETLPRDDLFQASQEELLTLSMGILHLQERRRIRLFVRRDIYGRFLSCLVFIPKDQYDSDIRLRMQHIIQEALHADSVEFVSTYLGESILARLHFIARIEPKNVVDVDFKELEQKLVDAARSWADKLQEDLIENYGEERGNALSLSYAKAFPAGYRELFSTRTAVFDIEHIESLNNADQLAMTFFKYLGDKEGILRFKLFHLGQSIPLSDALPILENMGLRVMGEQPHKVVRKEQASAWINDFSVTYQGDNSHLNVDEVRSIFQEAFAAIWDGYVENDGFNGLILGASLNCHEVTLLRAYAKYLKQVGFTFSQSYIQDTLANHTSITRLLVQLFHTRFSLDVDGDRMAKVQELTSQILTALDGVSNLDEDKILRRYVELINATMRTNYFQRLADGAVKPYISFKFDPSLMPELPLPKPMFEVWVYSPRVEGIHLRSSKVARGGLRWSDRQEDFRTEVLGLMKAQKVKNAVIVPSGAKGGFIPKALPQTDNRDELMQEVISNYKVFISGLLDITDNLVAGDVVPPQDVVRHDEDDTYLVVAADKGTASFSDYANQVAQDYGFWLGDAFASGGATGYDHKKMAITARGAWESTKRHFRELGRNCQTEDFTVVGIGDLAGDVFGNGMLMSKHIRLVAAFNHQHIFLDPNPDAKTSFVERQRIFNLPRSSWEDYDASLISPGGGVFKRSAKSIYLSSEIQALLGIHHDKIEPNELIRHILKAEVDLLWNGGIGTFVKASYELNEHVGDKTNNAIRVNGAELRAKVVVEGGNLGFTQLGRIEYALQGGRIFTDFIDNSGGVDCSDHEVNLKILLNGIVANGDMTVKQRNQLLVDMTDNVAALVLKNNYWQTQAINIALTQAVKNHDLLVRFIESLESQGKLDREIEYLPDDKELLERKVQAKGLTAPEIAVLLSYSKITLKESILDSDVPEDPYLCRIISTAFPDIIREKFHDAMEQHSLRRDIIATQLSNVILNKMGITYVLRMQEETGVPVGAVVRAYAIAHEVFNVGHTWQAIEALDFQVSTDIQKKMMLGMSRLVRRATRWILRNHRDLSDIQSIINLYKAGASALQVALPDLLGGTAKDIYDSNIKYLTEAKVPDDLAVEVAVTGVLISGLDIMSASREYDLDTESFAKCYFELGAKLDLAWLRTEIVGLPEENHWDALAKAALRDDVDIQQRQLAVNFMHAIQDNPQLDVDAWLAAYPLQLNRWQRILLEIRGVGSTEYVKFAVTVRELIDLTAVTKAKVAV